MSAARSAQSFTLGSAVRSGARMGFWSALLYGALATLYIILRSSLQIGRVLSPDEGLMGTLVANAFGVFWPSLVTTLLLAIPAALLGGLTLAVVAALCALVRRRRTPAQAAVIGFDVSALVVLLVSLLVFQATGGYWDAFWPEGYWFWVGLPSLLFVAATTWMFARQASSSAA